MSEVEKGLSKTNPRQQEVTSAQPSGAKEAVPPGDRRTSNRWMVLALAIVGGAAVVGAALQWTGTLRRGSTGSTLEIPVPPGVDVRPAPSGSPAAESVVAPIVAKPDIATAVAVPDATTAEREVREAVDHWALAWSRRDVDAYLASYSEDFKPPDNLSLAQWKERRAARVRKPKFIKVTLGSVEATVVDGVATVRFDQSFESDQIKDRAVKKELVLKQQNGRWLITSETAL